MFSPFDTLASSMTRINKQAIMSSSLHREEIDRNQAVYIKKSCYKEPLHGIDSPSPRGYRLHLDFMW